MLLLLFTMYGVLLSTVAGVIANYKGRSFFLYFTFSIVFFILGTFRAFYYPNFSVAIVFFIPLLGIIGALVAKAKPTEGALKTNWLAIALTIGVTYLLLIFVFQLLLEEGCSPDMSTKPQSTMIAIVCS